MTTPVTGPGREAGSQGWRSCGCYLLLALVLLVVMMIVLGIIIPASGMLVA